MSELRDLEADRRLFTCALKRPCPRCEAGTALLDEIDRLKRLLVRQRSDGWYGCITPVYATEADAWAAVRKAANDGK